MVLFNSECSRQKVRASDLLGLSAVTASSVTPVPSGKLTVAVRKSNARSNEYAVGNVIAVTPDANFSFGGSAITVGKYVFFDRDDKYSCQIVPSPDGNTVVYVVDSRAVVAVSATEPTAASVAADFSVAEGYVVLLNNVNDVVVGTGQLFAYTSSLTAIATVNIAIGQTLMYDITTAKPIIYTGDLLTNAAKFTVVRIADIAGIQAA